MGLVGVVREFFNDPRSNNEKVEEIFDVFEDEGMVEDLMNFIEAIDEYVTEYSDISFDEDEE